MHPSSAPTVPRGDDLDWDAFFGPLDRELVFECTSTVSGRFDSVCVYRRLIVIESGDAAAGNDTAEIPVARVSAWRVDLEGGAARVAIRAGREHVGHVPAAFARALRVALHDVLGPESA
ncbi:hypothetical protein GCM10025867_05290 [Frondihabitans sucicola]|uniref:DUF304 domain-containing protein n=1 Tax=Frondihabitans sucicola TaxID=1268041 RepID=A0ABM8GIT9_9MICO|nr:hypothetical protein [Frondihabitans sucicola]BDZ48288.1 hypothetical protein GCM10025867_05290 [Frondihabitans sucicola]